MSHFNAKSLMFYGTMIGSVLIFFKVVSTYGENHLNAPPLIGGIYPIQLDNLPQCLSKKAVKLTIDQSGIYLFGQLTANSLGKNLVIPLEGTLHQNDFYLRGKVNIDPNSCPDLTNQKLVIEGKTQEKTISGAFIWHNPQLKSAFTARLNSVKNQDSGTH